MSLVKTLAKKYKTRCTKIYKKYGATIKTDTGDKKVIRVSYDREHKKPLIAYFGGISLKWNKWVNISEKPMKIWNSQRSELVQRLNAQKCELCGSQNKIEVHHIRKLANLDQKGIAKAAWQKKMIARKRKTLIVCQECHNSIHAGKYNGKKLSA